MAKGLKLSIKVKVLFYFYSMTVKKMLIIRAVIGPRAVSSGL